MKDKAKLETALTYMGMFYDKILFVDFEKDSFYILKINDDEYNKLHKDIPISLSKWIDIFIHSRYFKPYGNNRSINYYCKYTDVNYLNSISHPMVLEYQKLIHETYHDIELTMIPFGKSFAYIYVKDNTKLNRKK